MVFIQNNDRKWRYESRAIHTVKTWVLNSTPQFAAQFMGCYYNTDQVKGVKKGVKGDNWQSITPLTPLHRVLENHL